MRAAFLPLFSALFPFLSSSPSLSLLNRAVAASAPAQSTCPALALLLFLAKLHDDCIANIFFFNFQAFRAKVRLQSVAAGERNAYGAHSEMLGVIMLALC